MRVMRVSVVGIGYFGVFVVVVRILIVVCIVVVVGVLLVGTDIQRVERGAPITIMHLPRAVEADGTQ